MVFVLTAFLSIQAQEFQGMAVYQSKTSSAEMMERFKGNKDMTPEMQKRIEERMKSMFEKTFTLYFDKSASIYKEDEKLEAPGQNNGGGGMRMWSSMMGSGGMYYKNVKEKTYIIDKEFMSKQFLVKDSLPKLIWKIEGESRMIGGYNCFKATAVLTVTEPNFNALRPKSDEEKKKEEESKGKKTNFLDNLLVPKEAVITAWYTPEIPVNQGPDKYWGLPGLILEINDGKTVILCSKIVLNPKEKAAIKPATTGKVIAQKEYDEIVVKKTKEFMESNQRPGGGGRGPGGPGGGRG